MAEPTTVARPYAEAAFALAREEDALPVWSEMLRFAAEVIDDEKVQAAVANPKLGTAEKESLFLSICGDRLNAQGRNFIRVLIEADRIELLPFISRVFDQLRNEAEGVAQATIRSAFPIQETDLRELASKLERKFQRKVETTVSVDPSLIGGVVIRIGDQVIDASVHGKLAAMKSQLA